MANLVTERVYKFDITEGKRKERLDLYLANTMERATRSRIQQLIKAGYVKVNDKIQKANYKINPKDIVVVTIPCSPRPDKTEAEDIPLNIIYEDEYLLIVNKPAGMVVHPSLGNFTGTMVNALLHHTKNLSENNSSSRPGIVHRIDKETSGLLVVAKDEYTHSHLAKQFAAHTIEREYQAVCWGLFKQKKGEISGNITRSKKDRKVFSVHETDGKYAHTFYEVIEEFEFASLVKLRLLTGRTHQIRVHMAYINHPVFGDPVYNGRKIICGAELPKMKARVSNLLEIMKRQALHAKTLGFIHPATEKFISFSSPLPEDIAELIKKMSVSFSE